MLTKMFLIAALTATALMANCPFTPDGQVVPLDWTKAPVGVCAPE